MKQIGLRMSSELREAFDALARSNFRSLNSELIATLQQYLDDAAEQMQGGIPYAPPASADSPRFTVRIPLNIYQRMVEVAARHGRSLNAEFCAAAYQAVERAAKKGG